MADPAWYTVRESAWGDEQARLIRLAAMDPRVERLFLHPALKRDLCRRAWPDRSWLRVVRPWYGHNEEFQDLLAVRADLRACVAADTPPPGAGGGRGRSGREA